MQRLHLTMFGDVWRWAGKYRLKDTNIGVPAAHEIREHLQNVYADARAWLAHDVYSPGEFAARLHYRIVTVHPFPNGNGRHARMVAHVVLVRHFKHDLCPGEIAPYTRPMRPDRRISRPSSRPTTTISHPYLPLQPPRPEQRECRGTFN